MNKITFQDWHYSCGEPGCCDDYGTRISVNGFTILEYADVNSEDLKEILNALKVEFEIEHLDDDGE
jgi:hypothetical protein